VAGLQAIGTAVSNGEPWWRNGTIVTTIVSSTLCFGPLLFVVVTLLVRRRRFAGSSRLYPYRTRLRPPPRLPFKRSGRRE
jgi:hypothetical protein